MSRPLNAHALNCSALLSAALPLLLSSACFAQLRIVSYNDSGNVAGSGGMLAGVFKAIGDETRAGIKRPADIISIQEQDTSLASTTRALNAINGIYGAGTYAASTIHGVGDSTQAVLYNTQTVQLVSQLAFQTTSTSGTARQPLRFQFRPVGYTSTADFYVYSSHYKADSDTTSTARRGVEATATRANADALGAADPSGTIRAIYTGDFNSYDASEPVITNLTAAGGAGRAFDPINRLGAWHNNSSFADVDTQSPINASGVYYTDQVGGGMDDRFDFQLVTAPVMTTHGVSYIANTYHAFGNANGLQYNADITKAGAAAALLPYFTAAGYTQADVQAALQAIIQTSDHVPVVADYRLPAKMSVVASSGNPTRVIVGATVNVGATIANTVPVAIQTAGDELDYAATLSGSPTTAQSGAILATGAAQTTSFALNTSTPGAITSTLNVTTSSPGAANPTSNTNYAYTVLAHASPSLSASSKATNGNLNLGIVAVGRTANASVPIFNLADLSGFTAKLNVTGGTLSGDATITASPTSVSNIDAGTSGNVGVTFAPAGFGAATSILALSTADEALPGAAARDTLQVNVSAFGAYAGDADLNDTVDFNDLLILAAHYTATSGATWTDGDFDRNGTVDFNDLLGLAADYGHNGNAATASLNVAAFEADWSLAQSLVPEPASVAGLLLGATISIGRRRARASR